KHRCTKRGLTPFGARSGGAGHLADGVHLEDVALLDVVVAVDGEAALEALGHLADIVLEALERADPAVVDDGAVADDAHLRAALDGALGDHASGDRADPRRPERLPHLDLAQHLLD